MNYFKNCNLCPRNCNINREKEHGYCHANNKLKIARAALHYYEEPCISGTNGSGAIFFTYCNLKCIFCQNYEISTKNIGKEISIEKLSDICLNLQNQGANNINLVTPTHYIPLIKKALIKAKNKGLTIPIIYNTSGYEKVSSLKLLEGLIDIYIPDLKYKSEILGKKYSNAPDYFNITTKAIKEMYRQVGKPKFSKEGIMQKGLIVRHLAIPENEKDSKEILTYLYNTYKNNIYISLMNQYTPIRKTKYNELNRKLSKKEYYNLIDYAISLGIENCFVQEEGTQKKSFIPDFKNQVF